MGTLAPLYFSFILATLLFLTFFPNTPVFFFLMFIYLFLRDYEQRERQKERDTEDPKQGRAVSAEPVAGLKLTNHEISSLTD